MFKSHRFLVPVACLAGVLSIVGVGFSAWIFVDDLKPVTQNAEAGVMVTEHLDAGILRLVAEEEARAEVYPNRDPYDYTISSFTPGSKEEEDYNTFATLVNQYSYRKIVFSEGNPDISDLSDGLQFLRFYYDKAMDVKTFKEEPEICGKFLIPAEYEQLGVNFHIGVRAKNIDVNQKVSPDGSLGIDDFIQINDLYAPNIKETDPAKQNFFKVGENYYSSFDSPLNKGLYKRNKAKDNITVITSKGEKIVCSVYDFCVDLNKMFIYEKDMKPYNHESIKRIYDAIEQSKNDNTVETKRRIQFEFASSLY